MYGEIEVITTPHDIKNRYHDLVFIWYSVRSNLFTVYIINTPLDNKSIRFAAS